MFRFTIRDVLWLMVVVAVSLGWWNEHRKFAAYFKLVSGQPVHWKPREGGASNVNPPDENSR